MRRLLAAAGAAALLMVGVAPIVAPASEAAWTLTATPGSIETAEATTTLDVVAQHSPHTNRETRVRLDAITLSPPTGLPDGCGSSIAPVNPNDAISGRGTTHARAVNLTTSCNGVYTVGATATLQDRECVPFIACGGWRNHSTKPVTSSIRVAVAPPAVQDVGAEVDEDGRVVTVTWDGLLDAVPDLAGYTVDRKVGDGDFAEVGSVSPDQTSLVDDSLPPEAGEATYRVRAVRPAPDGAMVSAAGVGEAVPFKAAPPGSTPPGDGDGDGDGGGSDGGDTDGDGQPDDGTGAPDGPGDPGEPGAGGRPGGSGGGGSVKPPRLGITGTFLPPLLRPSRESFGPTTSTTLDTGFDDSLPYDTEPGEEDPVLPDDEMAAFLQGGDAGRGMAIPVATALVLAVWAFHLRFLARASRPEGY